MITAKDVFDHVVKKGDTVVWLEQGPYGRGDFEWTKGIVTKIKDKC